MTIPASAYANSLRGADFRLLQTYYFFAESIERFCILTDLNWPALPDLRPRLEKLGVKVSSITVTLSRPPDDLTYDSLDEASAVVRTTGGQNTITFAFMEKSECSHSTSTSTAQGTSANESSFDLRLMESGTLGLLSTRT